MAEVTVAVVAIEADQRTILQMQVDSTAMGKTVHTFSSFPVGASDLSVRRMQEANVEVVIVDIPRHEVAAAIRAVELLHAELPKSAVFAVGDASQPQAIIAAMRAGAREFLERPTTTSSLLEAFVRLATARRRPKGTGTTGKVFTFVNAKGGSGATTIAVNTALALQSQGSVALVDLAPLGHAALHLNAKPTFTIADAIRNAKRLDDDLLDGYMTRCTKDLHLLAGIREGFSEEISTEAIARIFEVLMARYRHVVVDASSRLDRTLRTVCDLSQTVLLVGLLDVPSLWSVAKVRDYLLEGSASANIGLVLNRFHKLPGFSETEIETSTQTKIMSKIPNHYAAVSSAIDRGIPLVGQNHSDIARTFVNLAHLLTQVEVTEKRRARAGSLFGLA
jgi:pilus assembly protein CpaE